MKEGLLDEILESIGHCIQRNGVHVSYKNHEINFANKKLNTGEQELLTRGSYLIYVHAGADSAFDYVTGTFERKRTREHTMIVITPDVPVGVRNASKIDANKLRLLLQNAGDILEESGKIQILRHYRF